MTTPAPTVCADAWTLYGALGPFTQADPAAGWPLLRLCDAYARMIQPVDDLVRDVGVLPGWSQILDVDRCPTGVLPWLGQFVGVDADPSLSDAAQRAQLTAQQAEARGTPATILAVARAFVTPGATVRLTERDGDAYHLTVTLFSQQLIGASYNTLQTQYPTQAGFQAAFATYNLLPGAGQEVVPSIKAAVPAGLVCTVNTDAHATYAEVQATYPTQAGFQAAFATWADVAAWIPPS